MPLVMQLTSRGGACAYAYHAQTTRHCVEEFAPMIGQFDRRRAAVLTADIVGYGRLIAEDAEATLTALQLIVREIVKPAIVRAGGRLVKTNGDGILVELPEAVGAVRCAIAIHRGMATANRARPRRRQIRCHMGLACGPILGAGTDIFGATVILASRLQDLAAPGGLCVPRAVIDELAGRVPELPFQAVGPRLLKNWPVPVEVYAAVVDTTARAIRAA
jgi:adenylate cyclase